MRQMKPWTLCARRVRPAYEELLAATPFQIEGAASVQEWVRALPFLELNTVDDICQQPNGWNPKHPRSTGASLLEAGSTEQREAWRQRLSTQLAMRLACVLDVARHGPESIRKAVPWTGDAEKDLRYMLTYFWRGHGMWWASYHGHRHPEFH